LESKTNYFTVGITVLLLATGLLISALWLSTGFDKKTYNTYIVYMHESVSGLTLESPVKYNGVKVGSISEIQLNEEDPQRVKLLIDVEEGTPVTTSTKATLVAQGITGTTYLGLSSTSSASTPLQATPGEPYPVIPCQPSFFYMLEKNITRLTKGLTRVFDKENTKNLKKTLNNLERISTVIEQNNANLNKSLQDLPRLIQEIRTSAHQFNAMSQDLAAAGLQVSNTMRAGRNSIDKISQQAIPPAVTLLRKLNLIAANLEKASAEIRQNPAVIVRGSATPKPGPGERR
jgi:phospholipid/cholesterol/gamma-HCH transport system substrate-binding protein